MKEHISFGLEKKSDLYLMKIQTNFEFWKKIRYENTD